ncbi:M-phase inducer phosphatase [Sitodiplosis mosellana]|uniref:M-phase inducer phosphatase n=1 Tax=Sitodiplosis mosellana TaxID=263140 RepID=UPI002443EA9B|nr:M-phase inducer phosphatase [Sitodiplosis mosellana]XP_055317362.1 M-phase inducer phosphatase [Sitodiplosis mosellana]XP_055317363.1 M-phase inducer phosphatase [Sitodiplosis mosellana]XP_055317364.1 M-phase inducer phosphatase [Sitodiplosis mosellana]XP_055317365.1 M-phase inducer phosphatase [Sitodiplosis mosellana]XP_055317366.1 M-phase inducer phosphatase [Sitodiplosis mosellana]XP_055317367.1 M-phase inducer phosphatase [Sitodiplosis mosellana]XP_055317368.1 M-phase inducer phosphat
MDSHETDSKSSRNFNKLTEQVVTNRSIDADTNAILNSSANTNEYKGIDVTVQSNRDHNVPDNSQQLHHSHQSKVPHTRSTSMTGDVVASTSDQAITGISSRKSKQRKSDSSSSSPAMSPSYIQNKQYRTNTPRNVDLIENVMHSNDNKENVPGIHAQYGSATTEHRLDSPKFALQQNSPNTPLSSYKSPCPSTHSSPMYTAHEPRTDCNIFTYSPLITEPFKNSTYFHFPDVDTPSPIALATSQEASRAHSQLSATSFSTLNNNNMIIATDDKKNNQATLMNNNNNNNYNRSNYSSNNIQIGAPDECCSSAPKVKAKEAAVRRARLKSISLDSDGARLVEENLCIPVEELMERALAQTASSFDEDTPFHSPANLTSSEHQSHTKCLSKNINHLVLDLSIKDDSLPNVDYQSSPSDTKDEHFKFSMSRSKSTTPKTPTLTQTRQKAISLDSDPKYEKEPSISLERGAHTPSAGNSQLAIMRSKPHLMPNFLCVESNASMSVPTTPRRQQLVKNTLSKLNTNNSKGVGSRKTGFASSAEYFASKKANERKCNEKLQLNPETEPILEGTVVDYYDDVYAIEHENTSSFETSTDDVDCDIICGSANSLISNCGGTSGTNNHSNNNSGSNFSGFRSNMSAAGLSLSNYSLSNFQGSHCSLTRSNYNIFGMTSAAAATTTPMATVPASNSQTIPPVKTSAASSKCFAPSTQPYQPATIASSGTTVPGSRSNFCMKKNLLQRRGSNTSLTLNIVGGTHAPGITMQSTLNRFNSHNALNAMSTPFDMQRANTTIATAKKGLLERRNSNASLTLQLECRSNIQKRALSTSNCYLRGSDLSLSSSNNFESHLEEHRICTMCGGDGILKAKNTKRSTSASGCNSESRRSETHYQTNDDGTEDALNEKKSMSFTDQRSKTNRSGRRKFFSSENLNIHQTFSLSQAPIKTSSVVDLNQSNSEMDDVYDDQETSYCPCTTSIIRNITTKPLSPQTTSEDFKIYLANIQILQNASNLLTDHKLTTLSNVFNRSYGRSTVNDEKPCDACETCTICKTCKECLTKCRCEQNCLLTNLHQEFWDLPTNYQEKPLVFGSQVKNRYKTILPNEHSRVILEAEVDSTSQAKEQPTSELYINANYIKGPDYTQNSYIATQGPMTNTIYDFWLMVYQNYKKNLKSTADNVDLPFQQKIAMLTDIIENDESKCAIYFPQNTSKFLCFLSNEERRHKDCQQSQSQLEAYFAENDHEWFNLVQPNEIHTEVIVDDNWPNFPAFNFNFFSIKTVDCLNKGGYTIRKFHCLYHTFERLHKTDTMTSEAQSIPSNVDDGAIERKVHLFLVYHYWFPHWPDHRSPENIDVVLDMCINLIDSDCEQELLSARNDLSADAANNPTDEDDFTQPTTSNELQTNIKWHSMPMMLNQVPFNGAIPIIHCSAGIGRTGCVAAILNGLRQLRLSYLSSSTSSALNADTTKHASVDVLGIVSNLRLQRGGMVQNSEQYELIHRALCLYHQRYLSK